MFQSGLKDIPNTFNVTMLRDDKSTPRVVYSSKAIGEPPLCLATSVFFAIREAIKAYRHPQTDPLKLTSPATAEKIRMACQDQITEKVSVDLYFILSYEF